MKALLRKIRQILKDRRTRKIFTRFISTVAAIVVFVTTYALVLPAITMESQAMCGIEAHQHSDSCYEKRLTCGLEESETHTHTDSCYEKVLVCGKENHTHSTACYHLEKAAAGAPIEIAGVASTESAALAATETASSDPAASAAAETTSFDPASAAATDPQDDSSLFGTDTSSHAGTTPANTTSADTIDPATNSALTDTSNTEFTEDSADTESIADTEDTTNTEDKSSTGTPLDPEDNTAADPADTAATEASADFENQKDTSETSNADPSSADPASEDFSDASHTTTSDQPTTDTNDTTSQITADTPADTPDGTDNAATTAPADPANGATNAEPVSAGYVPALEELNFNTILNKNTTVYYHHQTSEDKPAEETTADDTNNQTMDDSGKQTAADTDNQTIDDGNDQTTADITDWKQTDKNTVLGENDLLRVYLAYTIPAGSLNETNPTARYRLPENIHLTDDQIDAINTNVNGIAAQYINYETLEITDLDAYNKTLGIEAVDGDRTPEDDLNEYLQNHDNQEFISATVRAEKVYAGQNLNSTDDQDSKDKENNEDDTAFNSVDQTDYLGTDLVFSFTPYTIQKNCHEYDSNGKPTKAGEKIKGWVVLDLTTDQLDWIKAADSKETDTADIIFAEEDKELKIKEISTTLILAPATESADKNKDDSAQSRNEGSSEDASTKKEETSDKKLDSSEEDSSSKTSAEISKEIDLSKYPAVTFNDKIIVNAGTLNSDTEAGAALESETELTVHVEADEGTFPEGTTMRLAEADDDAVAEAVQGTINGKTKGFHAVDISFWAAPNPADPESEPFEIEPLKPIRVSITSEAIRQAVEDNSTAPLVVHVEDVKTAASGVNSEDQDISGTSDTEAAEELASAADDSGPSATIMDTSETTAPVTSDKTSDTTDTLTFEAGTFSVYAIIYTVDFHWSKNGQDQTFSISGGSAISLSELLPIMEIVKDDPATPVNEVNSFIKEIDLVEFSNPDLVFVAKVSKATTVGTFKEEYGLNVQYSSDLSDAQIHEINEKKVEPEDWLLISLKPFESTETLTIHMTNGDIFSIHVTDAVVTTESDFLKYANSGRSFYLFTNSVLYDYYLKYDGGVESEYTSARSDGGYLYDELGDDFVWTLKQNESGNWIIRNVGHSDYYITLKDSNHITSKDSNTAISMNPRNDTGRFDGFQIVNPGTSQAINFFYNGIWDYGFNTVLRNNNWGARMYLIPKAFEITYTQDNIQHGYVHFPYYTGTVATNESYQSFIIFTNTISAGEQSGYKVTASPEDGYHFIRWEASGEGTIQAWGTGNETNQSPAIQPIVTGGNVTLTAVFGKNPDVIFTQDDLSHGYVQYTSSTGTVKTKPGTPEFSVGTKTSGQTVYAISAVPETGYHFVEWQVANGSEKLTAWGSSGVVTKNNQIIQPYINGEGVRLKAVFAKNPVISVTQDDITKGHVKYNNGNTDTYTDNSNLTGEVLTSGPDSDNQYHSFGYITAEPEEGYRFVKWEVTGPGSLEDWGNDSTVNEKSLQIMPYIQNGNVSLKAIFEKIPPSISDLDPNSAAAKLVTELQEEMKKESAKMTKTAHVLDAEKRTYQIDMTASSERKVIGPTIELSFITDVSRSMWFPANIEKVTYKSNDNLQPDSGGSNLQNWLDRNGKNSDGSYKVFYMIADINESATMLAIYHEGGEWRTMDASYYDDKINGRHENYKEGRAATLYSDTMYYDSSLGWVIKTGADNDTIDAGHSKAYPITDLDKKGNIQLYTAYSTTDGSGSTFYNRLDYLTKALQIICDVAYAVDPNAKLGLITFAKESATRYRRKESNGSYTDGVYRDAPTDNNGKKIYVANQYGKGDKIGGKTIQDQVGSIALTGGTRQDFGLKTAKDKGWYEENADHQQVAILITDGAPNVENTGITNPWDNKITPAANDLKNQDVELYTLGLSLENVGTNKQSLYSIAGKKNTSKGNWNSNDGKWDGIDYKYQNNAETGEDLINTFMDIIRNLETIGNLLGSVSDTIDEAFYPIDETGKPLKEGVYSSDGNYLGKISDYLDNTNKPLERIKGTYRDNPLYSSKNETPYYTWTQKDGKWTITWYNQLITKAAENGTPGWKKSIQVKAKEDFLGGNAINTNADLATISADRFKQQGYPNYIGTFDEPVTSSVETPRVNVVELGLDNDSTQWTVYLDTKVNSIEQLKALYKKIQIHERVTKADSDNRIATDGNTCLPTDTAAGKIPITEKLDLKDADWINLIAGQIVEKPYNDYQHKNVGTLKVELRNEGRVKDQTLNGEHPATSVGIDSEKYTLIITYTPKSPDATTIWNTTPEKSQGREAEEMISTNVHRMNVYAIPLRIVKRDNYRAPVAHAEFSIYRTAKDDETGVSIEEYDETKVGTNYYCVDKQESDRDGICVLGQPSMGETSHSLLVAKETYYLIETKAPEGYMRDENVREVTLETTKGLYTNLSGTAISTATYPYNWNQGVTLKIDGTPGVIVDINGSIVNPVDEQGNPRSYVLNMDETTFQTTITNIKLTTIAIKKVDAGNSNILLAHAVFSLYDADALDDKGKIKKDAEALRTGVTTLTGEDLGFGYIDGLGKGTYYLVETAMPDGYVMPDYDFIKITVLENEVKYQEGLTGEPKTAVKTVKNGQEEYCIQVYNNPGYELPSTGGPGTTHLYLLGLILTALAAAGLTMKHRINQNSRAA